MAPSPAAASVASLCSSQGNVELHAAKRSSTPRVEALDLLLVAVLGVVLYHFGFWGPGSNGIPAIPWLMPVAKYGFRGVPAFFVISGFVIAYSTEGRTAVGFAIARFGRIYPNFVFCMTLTFLALLVWGPPHFEATPAQWFANLFIAAPALGPPLHGCGLPAQRWTREFLTGHAVRFGRTRPSGAKVSTL